MIYSSRHILEMRQHFLSITSEQWVLLVLGLILGLSVWVLLNKRIVHRVVGHLKQRSLKANAIAVVEGAIGSTIFLTNALLVYLSTLVASFFLFAFAVAGLLVGAWITIPASFE